MSRKRKRIILVVMNNVTVRTISGIAFIIVMVVCLMFNKFLFAGMMIFIMSVMLVEFYEITMGHSYTFSKVLAILAGIFQPGLLLNYCRSCITASPCRTLWTI